MPQLDILSYKILIIGFLIESVFIIVYVSLFFIPAIYSTLKVRNLLKQQR